PQLSVEPAIINLTATRGGQPVSGKLQVNNRGGGTLVFRASVIAQSAAASGWLSVKPDSGTTSIASPASLVVTGNPQTLEAGTHSGRIRIAPDGGDALFVDVFMTVSAGRQTMVLSQSGLTFTAVAQGGATPPQTFGVLNAGDGVMEWSAAASTLSGGPW